MSANFEKVLESASRDKVIYDLLLEKPSEIFYPNMEKSLRNDFDQFFAANISQLVKRTVGQGSVRDLSVETSEFPSVGCASCQVAAFSVSALIVAAAAAGLSTLTASSAVVLQLAAFAGVSSTTALAFIVSLGATIAGGVTEVVGAVCEWTGSCP